MPYTLHQLGLAAALTAASAAAQPAAAQAYPNRPVRMIAAQSAGSSLDTILRILATRMTDVMGQQIVIDNRGGAGGTIGVELAARSAPDGYTLLAGASSSMVISSFTYKKLPFDAIKDFDPISVFVNAEAVFVVNPALPIKSVNDFLALVKTQPGKLNMGSAGIGSSSHLAGLLFVSMTGINTVHVPYKGGGPMTAAIVGGESQWAISPAAALVGQIRAGRLRAIAISSKQRSPVLPELPTIDEAGVPGYEYVSWNAVFAPKGTPRSIIGSVHSSMRKTLALPEIKEQFALQGLAPAYSEKPQDLAAKMQEEYGKVAKLIKAAGIKPE